MHRKSFSFLFLHCMFWLLDVFAEKPSPLSNPLFSSLTSIAFDSSFCFSNFIPLHISHTLLTAPMIPPTRSHNCSATLKWQSQSPKPQTVDSRNILVQWPEHYWPVTIYKTIIHSLFLFYTAHKMGLQLCTMNLKLWKSTFDKIWWHTHTRCTVFLLNKNW